MTPIEPQKEGEALEDRVNGSEEEEKVVEEILDSLIETEEEVVEAPGSREAYQEILKNEKEKEMEGGDAEFGEGEDEEAEPEPEPIEAPVGPADFSTTTHVAPQVLEEAHVFLNRYGIRTDDLSPKEVMDKIEKIHVAKEAAAQVLSRGRTIDGMDRLLSFVPKGYVGEFKRENDVDIARARALGFEVFDDERANQASSTGKSDGLVRYGDQLLMIIREETYVANRLVKAARLAERRKLHSKDAQIDQKGSDPLFPLIKL